jgi:hypothetical protein
LCRLTERGARYEWRVESGEEGGVCCAGNPR